MTWFTNALGRVRGFFGHGAEAGAGTGAASDAEGAASTRSVPVATIARHGRLPRQSPIPTVVKIVAGVAIVAAVSAPSVAALAVHDVVASVKPPVQLVDVHGNKVTAPPIAALNGAFNVLLAGSDSGDGNAAYGTRGENLNDVTMLMHVSADHQHVTVVSFPRDMYVPIPSCPNPAGGSYSAMAKQRLNVSLTYGGLSCTVLTIEALTGLSIPYAALIQFDGVVAMSNAVGGVPVCVAGRIHDPDTHLYLSAGEHTLTGAQALAFLRTRHGVGDGSDLGRISNQHVFLSSLVRTIDSQGVLSNPVKVFTIAKAAASNMQLSSSLSNVQTIASMAVTLKGVDPSNIVFLQYPTHNIPGGAVEPGTYSGNLLMTALKNDQPVTLTGGTGVGAEEDTQPHATATPTATATSGKSGKPSKSATSSASASPAPTDASIPTAAPTPTTSAVALPNQIDGQTASEYTCSRPFHD